MNALADAMQVPLEMKHGGLKQTQSVKFQCSARPWLRYDVMLKHGYVSPDYETAAAVFHIKKDAFLLVEKSGTALSFSMLNLEGQDHSDLNPRAKSPRAIVSAAKKFVSMELGTRTIVG
jgi:hypothetical protein